MLKQQNYLMRNREGKSQKEQTLEDVLTMCRQLFERLMGPTPVALHVCCFSRLLLLTFVAFDVCCF